MSKLGCSCTILSSFFAVAFLSPSTWLVHLHLLCLSQLLDKLCLKNCKIIKIKVLTTWKRKLNWYGKSELINGTVLLFLMLPTIEWLPLLRNVLSIFWGCLFTLQMNHLCLCCLLSSLNQFFTLCLLCKKLYWNTVTNHLSCNLMHRMHYLK